MKIIIFIALIGVVHGSLYPLLGLSPSSIPEAASLGFLASGPHDDCSNPTHTTIVTTSSFNCNGKQEGDQVCYCRSLKPVDSNFKVYCGTCMLGVVPDAIQVEQFQRNAILETAGSRLLERPTTYNEAILGPYRVMIPPASDELIEETIRHAAEIIVSKANEAQNAVLPYPSHVAPLFQDRLVTRLATKGVGKFPLTITELSGLLQGGEGFDAIAKLIGDVLEEKGCLANSTQQNIFDPTTPEAILLIQRLLIGLLAN